MLAPGGRIVLSVSNRVRRARARGLVRALRSPWAADRLIAAGFARHRVVVPYPSRATWHWLIPLERFREPFGEPDPVADLRTALIRLWRALARLGLGRWISQDFFVVARTVGGDDDGIPIVPDTLDAVAGEPSPRVRSLSDARVAVTGQRRFAKIPLSPFQQQALVGELRNTELAAQTAFAPYVLGGGRHSEHVGVPVTDYPLVHPDARSDRGSDPEAAVVAILSELPADRRAPLADTATWMRLAGDHGAAECGAVGAAALREHVLESFAALRSPVGPTHGDLHADNVMFVDGRPLLVDWNRYESNNPLFLDSLYALVHEGQQRHGTGIADELVAYADGHRDGPLRALVDDSLGEFSRDQAALVLLLDRTVSYSEISRPLQAVDARRFRSRCGDLRRPARRRRRRFSRRTVDAR